MNITILNVAVETKPTAKGSYQVADVAFKNNSFGGKVEGKKVMSFGATSDAFKVLATAQPNDTFDVTVVKNDKGYNDWTALTKAGAKAEPQNSVSSGYARKSTPPSPRSGFETPEERAKRQVYIIRQSSVSNAIAALSVGAKTVPKRADILAEAKAYEAYVLGTGETGFDDVPDFDPTFNTDPQID